MIHHDAYRIRKQWIRDGLCLGLWVLQVGAALFGLFGIEGSHFQSNQRTYGRREQNEQQLSCNCKQRVRKAVDLTPKP